MINYIFQIAESIASDVKNQEIRDFTKKNQTEIESEINFLFENRAKAIEILRILFPDNIPVSYDLFNKLSDIQYSLSFKPISYKLCGILVSESYKLLSSHDAQKLLQLIVNDKEHKTWHILQSLPTFLSETELHPDFASSWFYSLAKEKSGAAVNGLYQAVESYSFNFPVLGLKVFESYIPEELDEHRLHLSSIILGALRSCFVLGSIQKEVIDQWDASLMNSPRIELRLCYHRSWVIPFWRGLITVDQLEAKLSTMMEGSQEEITEAFSVLHKCLLSNLKNEIISKFSLAWFNRNIFNKIPVLAKYYVAHSIFLLSDEIKENVELINTANNLIIKIQPVPSDNVGIWDDIVHYCVDLLHADKERFFNILTKLAEENYDGLFWQIKNNRFEYLFSEMAKSDVNDFITNLMISFDNTRRHLGSILFNKIKITSFDQDILRKADEMQLHILLLESICNPFLSEDMCRFFVMLEPYFQNASLELKKKFKDEMVMQAINYPGECLDNFKKVDNPSEIIKDVIESAEHYYQNLQNISQSPATSFAFPELKWALDFGNKESSRKISKGTQEKSILAKLCKHFDIIYGNQWSAMVEGNLGDPTPFKEISHSVELPRLELIDPEGMTIRRMIASAQINEYIKSKDKQ